MISMTNDSAYSLHVGELRSLGARFGVQTWPVVLDMSFGEYGCDAGPETALAGSDLIDHGEPLTITCSAGLTEFRGNESSDEEE